jgi:hypothetical protein
VCVCVYVCVSVCECVCVCVCACERDRERIKAKIFSLHKNFITFNNLSYNKKVQKRTKMQNMLDSITLTSKYSNLEKWVKTKNLNNNKVRVRN